MYAIIETGGKQYKVKPGDIIDVELLDAKDNLTFDNVLFVGKDDGQIEIGQPYVKDAKVSAKVLTPLFKDDKVTTFKYHNKTNYRRTIGHRQQYTRLEIEAINA